MKKKQLFSGILSVVMMLSSACMAYAKNDDVTIVVDDRVIYFHDQGPVISENDDTLIPLRGVLEAMGASVKWNGEERSVYVKASDNKVRLEFFIDNPIVTKYTLKTVMDMESTTIEASTAPVLMNERTMVPLRIIAENMNASIDWDGDKRLITIVTDKYKKFIDANQEVDENGEVVSEYNPKEILPYVYIEADKTEAKAGDIVTVSVKLANTEKLSKSVEFIGTTATLLYDSKALAGKEPYAVVNEEKIDNVLASYNEFFTDDSIKYIYIIASNDENKVSVCDGTVARFEFEVKDDTIPTTISLSNRSNTHLGKDVYFLTLTENESSIIADTADELYIDTTPIVINQK